MRAIAPLASALLAAGCATQPPPPLSDDMARIEMSTVRPADRLSAYRLDGELIRELGFPDLQPGAHEVQVRFQYEQTGSAPGGGMMGEIQWRACILAVQYDDFRPGQTYRIVANQLGFSTVGWLESGADGKKLVSAEVLRCGPGA